ncbi:MAG: hypothetical protein ACFFAU_16320 [Candidatus Hodarchaeota archaeon]
MDLDRETGFHIVTEAKTKLDGLSIDKETIEEIQSIKNGLMESTDLNSSLFNFCSFTM